MCLTACVHVYFLNYAVCLFVLIVCVCVSPMASIYGSREMNGALRSTVDYTANLLPASFSLLHRKQEIVEQKEKSTQCKDEDRQRIRKEEVRKTEE